MKSKENLISKETVIERKKFYFDLRENHRGKYLRVTEKRFNKKNRIIIPVTGLDEFAEILKEIKDIHGE